MFYEACFIGNIKIFKIKKLSLKHSNAIYCWLLTIKILKKTLSEEQIEDNKVWDNYEACIYIVYIAGSEDPRINKNKNKFEIFPLANLNFIDKKEKILLLNSNQRYSLIPPWSASLKVLSIRWLLILSLSVSHW